MIINQLLGNYYYNLQKQGLQKLLKMMNSSIKRFYKYFTSSCFQLQQIYYLIQRIQLIHLHIYQNANLLKKNSIFFFLKIFSLLLPIPLLHLLLILLLFILPPFHRYFNLLILFLLLLNLLLFLVLLQFLPHFNEIYEPWIFLLCPNPQ